MKTLLVTMVACVIATSSHAVDFSTVLTDPSGTPFKECLRVDKSNPSQCAEEADMTLGRAAMGALSTRFEDERNLSGADQVKRAALAYKINEAGTKDVPLDADQVKMIKDTVAKMGWRTTLVYRVWQLLDPASVKKD